MQYHPPFIQRLGARLLISYDFQETFCWSKKLSKNMRIDQADAPFILHKQILKENLSGK